MPSQKITIGVIGGAEASAENYQLAYDVGKFIADNNAVLISGGLSGTMEAASKGAFENGGMVIGFLPGDAKADANPYVHIAVPTGMGVARNVLVVRAADVLIAFPGSFGTLSEIGLALNLGKTVVYMPGTWDLKKLAPVDGALFKEAFDARQAIGLALAALR
ncbi:MAG: TIGR00725 family protein [Chitinivibrionales bacterium]